jgi:hypothetical protein
VNAVELYIAEALAVHAILDDLGAPREYDGQKLSMSQRLEMIRKDIKGLSGHLRQLHITALMRGVCGHS